ncbi:hypothetical protein [Reyranella sp.]|uniref:hypothetical protein n=1 Tax=Reyranella sp. TaxID=1929291 RepID=UPI003D101247
MANDPQKTVKTILAAWIARQYEKIIPYLTEDVVYVIGEGAAKSICHTPGTFGGRDKVKLWYDSHTWLISVYGESIITPLCGIVAPPQVVTYYDESQSTVIATGTVGLGVPQELPCLWMSTWLFKGDLVGKMTLVADSVGGVEQFAEARRKQMASIQASFHQKFG